MIRRLPFCHVVLFVKYFVITLNGMFEPRTNFDVITPTSWYVITALTFIMGLAICDPIRSSSPGSLPQGGGSDLWDFVEVSREHWNIVTTAAAPLPRSFALSLAHSWASKHLFVRSSSSRSAKCSLRQLRCCRCEPLGWTLRFRRQQQLQMIQKDLVSKPEREQLQRLCQWWRSWGLHTKDCGMISCSPLFRWSLYSYLAFFDDHVCLSTVITERQGTAMHQNSEDSKT